MNALRKIVKWYFDRKTIPFIVVLVVDCLAVLFSGYVGRYVEINGHISPHAFGPFTLGMLIITLLYLGCFFANHTFKGILRFSSFIDLRRILYASFEGAVIALAIWSVSRRSGLSEDILIFPGPPAILVLSLLTTLLLWTERIVIKGLYDNLYLEPSKKNAVIYGVRNGGVSLAHALIGYKPNMVNLVGFIGVQEDMDSGRYVMDRKVWEDKAETVDILLSQGVSILFVTPEYLNIFRENDVFFDAIINSGIRIFIMPRAEEWDGKSPLQREQFREVEIEDLLPRKKIELNLEGTAALLLGRRVLITGAAGSIGSEIVRQVASFKPSSLVLIDQAETPMHNLRLMLRREFPEIDASTIVASVTDVQYMERIFKEKRPEYVFHAAAYKHVPMMEDNPVEAVRNNVFGTKTMADLSVKYGVLKFVMISTDKAVNPTSVMGCSKRICEIYCQSLNNAITAGKVAGSTQFVTTRFGNVLGSNGSVIPLFQDQIRNGGPVTVTHPDVIRFFMLIPEACSLVLEAGTFGRGGEIFVFDMGRPVKIVDLAKRMISLSGRKNVQIVFTGLRDGEKLYEETLFKTETTIPTINSKIFIAKVRENDYYAVCKDMEKLFDASVNCDNEGILRIFKEIVPEYSTSACSSQSGCES